MTTYYPTDELVAQAWLGQRVPEILAAGGAAMVAGTLPAVGSWSAFAGGLAFCQATLIPGNVPKVDVPLRNAVIQVDCWAVSSADSVKPAWNVAAQLVEAIWHFTNSPTAKYSSPIQIALANYAAANLKAVYPLNNPRRVPNDPSGYARFTIDLEVDWAPVTV